jgi:hypothetical protein
LGQAIFDMKGNAATFKRAPQCEQSSSPTGSVKIVVFAEPSIIPFPIYKESVLIVFVPDVKRNDERMGLG